MTGRLANKVAFVTGAGHGIGRATSQAFAEAGAAVVAADIDGGAAEDVANQIEVNGGRAVATRCDVTDARALEQSIAEAAVAFGPFSIVMCNAAAMTPIATAENLGLDDWNTALTVNITGVFLTCKFTLPLLKAAGGGSIIITASQFARVGNPGNIAYCTTKGALLQMARVLALDHAGDNIRANTLSPGGTATRRLSRRYGDMETAEREWGSQHPVQRLGRVEEIAMAAVYLASDESAFMTGSDLLIDGGYAAR